MLKPGCRLRFEESHPTVGVAFFGSIFSERLRSSGEDLLASMIILP